MSHLGGNGVDPTAKVKKIERTIPHRIHLREQGGKGRTRYINIAANAELSESALFVLLFCAAQSEIQKHRMQGIVLKTVEVFNVENPMRPKALTFPMELMPEHVLDEFDLLEIPRNTEWPTPELR